MIRRIIEIDQNKCNGCGLCAQACHEGAIGMVDGKAKLLRDDYCDGLGDCLPACPTGAITFVEREAKAYDEAAVKLHMAAKSMLKEDMRCPGSAARSVSHNPSGCPGSAAAEVTSLESCLTNWPVQIKLAPVNAPYFQGANLLIAADCSAYAYGSFHNDFINGKITLMGCPKLDSTDYSEKLAQIIAMNDINSITLTRMEVPCCGGLEMAVKKAIAFSGKDVQLDVVTISINGEIL